jgi:hypothetical protein
MGDITGRGGMNDPAVNHPKHYTSHPSGIECIEVTRHMGFNLGNAMKYIWRADLKAGADGRQDLEKAAWYLADEIRKRADATAPPSAGVVLAGTQILCRVCRHPVHGSPCPRSECACAVNSQAPMYPHCICGHNMSSHKNCEGRCFGSCPCVRYRAREAPVALEGEG